MSGTFVGHALPAIFFMTFGGFFLLLTLKRCCDMQKKKSSRGGFSSSSSSSSPFEDVPFLPEKNHTLILRSGILVMICSVVGGFVEVGSGLRSGHSFFHQLAHQSLYICFLFVGGICYLEGQKLLFPNAHRYALTVTFLLNYILWNEHALMKVELSDVRIHMLQANVNFVAFVIFGYSAYMPKSLFAYVASWTVMTVNGMWMLTAGIACTVDIMAHTVGAFLVLETLFLVTVIALCSVCFLDLHSYNQQTGDEDMKYASVKEDEDEEIGQDTSTELITIIQ